MRSRQKKMWSPEMESNHHYTMPTCSAIGMMWHCHYTIRRDEAAGPQFFDELW